MQKVDSLSSRIKLALLQEKHIHPEIILLLVATVGEFVYLYFGLMASTAGLNEEKLAAILSKNNNTSLAFQLEKQTIFQICLITIANNLLDILQTSLQTFLLITAEGNHGAPIKWVNRPDLKRKVLKEILWFLFVCNVFKWASQSFLEDYILSNSEAKTLVFHVEKRTAITQGTYPLVLFYRFHSAVMLLEMQYELF